MDSSADDIIIQKAADKITDAAMEAEGKIADDAQLAAAALTGEVQDLRRDITVLQKIDSFKGKVYVVAIIAAIFEIAAFVGLWWVNADVDDGVRAIRTDLEVHRIRNEASHDCLAEKMAQLPGPEERAGSAVSREFLQEFLGCVTEVAPSIVPPGAPDLRITTRDERKRLHGE